jgi:hypothetical protein
VPSSLSASLSSSTSASAHCYFRVGSLFPTRGGDAGTDAAAPGTPRLTCAGQDVDEDQGHDGIEHAVAVHQPSAVQGARGRTSGCKKASFQG